MTIHAAQPLSKRYATTSFRSRLNTWTALGVAIVAVLVLAGCGTATPRVTASMEQNSTGTVVFGTGVDKTVGGVTGQGNAFPAGAQISWVAYLSGSPGSDVRVTVVRDDGATQQVVASADLGTPSATNRTLFNTLNTAAAVLRPGSYVLKIFHLDRELAEGRFQLTTSAAPPLSPSSGQGDASSIVAAINAYQQALNDVYGPGYSVSMLGEVASGRAARAVWCTVQGKADSLANTHAYLTYSNTSDQFQPVQFGGNTAVAPVHIQQRINLHRADGTVTGSDADYTMTFSLTNDGAAWKVDDYSWIGSDNSRGSAAQDAKACNA